jgi:hypothetical protein
MRQALAECIDDEGLRAELDAAFWKIADFIRNTEDGGATRPHPGRPMEVAPTPPRPRMRRRPPPECLFPLPQPFHPHPEFDMTTIQETAFARLESEGRLLNSVLKAATHKPGRFGFRGDIALKFQAKLADEARPPEISSDQVIAVAQAGEAPSPS